MSIQYPSWASDRCVTVHRGHRREGAPPLPKPWLPSLQTAFLEGCHSSSSRCKAGKEMRQAVCHSGSWKRSVFLCIHRERLTHCSWEAPRDEAHCFCLENGLGSKRMTSFIAAARTGAASRRGGKEGDNGHRWAKSSCGPHCGHGATPGEWEPHSAPQITPQPQYSTIQTHNTQQSTELHCQHSSHLRILMVPGRFSSLPSAYPLLPKNTKVFLSCACGLFLTQ